MYATQTTHVNVHRPKNGDELLQCLENQQREVIERIFSFYCSFGDPMNSQWLKSSKFIKFLRDSGLLKQGALHDHDLKQRSNRDQLSKPRKTAK